MIPGAVYVAHEPGFRAGLADPHGQVGKHTDAHARLLRGGLRRRQLLLRGPLKPLEELHPLGLCRGELLRRGGTRVAQFLGPLPPVGAVDLAERAPDREITQRAAATATEPIEGQLACGAASGPEQLPQRFPFPLPYGVTVDNLAIATHGLPQFADPASHRLGKVGVFGNRLGPDVQRAQETPAGG